jgi:HAE1 family hydrophobic/amphiphilic exporter-1
VRLVLASLALATLAACGPIQSTAALIDADVELEAARASGAGAEGRKVMGMAVFAGMLVATILGVVLVPVLFVVIERLFGGKGEGKGAEAAELEPRKAAGGHA